MFAIVGLSHHTAPIVVRERAALGADDATALLQAIAERANVSEALIVSTCNRLEVLVCGSQETTEGDLLRAAREPLEARTGPLSPHLYQHLGNDAVLHLFRVAASLDSLVVGEPQILGQVKRAMEAAQEAGTFGPVLRRITTQAVRVAKRVRTETALGVGQVSVPSVSVDLTRQIYGDLRGKRAVLIGGGEMGQSVAKQLGAEGAALTVVGRSRQRAEELAALLSAEPCGLESLDTALVAADVVIAMTSATHYVVERERVAQLTRRRRGRSLFFVDLSVPRNIDPGVEALDNVFLYNIDDLSQIVQQRKSSRQDEAEKAEALVRAETQSLRRAASAEQATPTIVALRRRLSASLHEERERSQRGKLKHLSEADHQSIARFVDAAVNKLLHTPTVLLRDAAIDPDAQRRLDNYVAALTELFELELDPEAHVTMPPQLRRAPQSIPPGGPTHTEASGDGLGL